MTEKDNYFMHHGIQGQKWGVSHGPPYPLDSSKSTGSKLKDGARVVSGGSVSSKAETGVPNSVKVAKKEAKAEENYQKQLNKAQKKNDIAKVASLKAQKMSNEELAKEIARMSAEISYVKIANELNKAYITSSMELNNLSNSKEIQARQAKAEEKRRKDELKAQKQLIKAQTKSEIAIAKAQAKNSKPQAAKQIVPQQPGQQPQQNKPQNQNVSLKQQSLDIVKKSATTAVSNVLTSGLTDLIKSATGGYMASKSEELAKRSYHKYDLPTPKEAEAAKRAAEEANKKRKEAKESTEVQRNA